MPRLPPDKLSGLLRPRGTPLWAAAITGRLIIEKCPAPEDENTAKTSLWYSHRSHGGREYHFRSVLEFSSPKATPLATEVSLKTAESSDTSPEARQFIRPPNPGGSGFADFCSLLDAPNAAEAPILRKLRIEKKICNTTVAGNKSTWALVID